MTATATATRRPVITAWSAVSPFGIGRAAFTSGLSERRATAGPLGTGYEKAAQRVGCLVPGFDIRTALGRKGTRSMDRVTGLTVTAVGALLEESERNRRVGTGESAAFTLGTTTGSAQSMMDFTRDSLTGGQPFFVDPAQFPNTVMNCASGQSAIWYQLKGPNTTVAGGRTAGLHALNYARRLLAAGRAESVLCGASEEFSAARSWLEHYADTSAPLGEGSAILLVEPAADDGQPVLAEILAVELGVALGGDARAALASCLRRALDQAGVGAGEIVAVAPSSGEGGDERGALRETLGSHAADDLALQGLIGDTGAAAAGFQLASLVALAETEPGRAAGRVGLVTSVDRTGSVGCALLRMR